MEAGAELYILLNIVCRPEGGSIHYSVDVYLGPIKEFEGLKLSDINTEFTLRRGAPLVLIRCPKVTQTSEGFTVKPLCTEVNLHAIEIPPWTPLTLSRS